MKRRFTLLLCFSLLALLVVISSCEKETDNTENDQPTDYFQLEIGKYIIYRLDSLRFTNFGLDEVTNSYQAKEIVEGTTTDLLGRPGWRIQRYLRPLNSTNENDWRASLSYELIKGDNTLEVSEGNLRFVKLQGPIKEGRSWLGNGYLPDEPYSQYEFSVTESMEFWDYSCESFGATEELNGKTYDNTITITQINDSSDVPVIDINQPGSKTVWVEKYAKNIGLIYRDVALWEYQPPVGADPGKKVGFGVRLSILDHN